MKLRICTLVLLSLFATNSFAMETKCLGEGQLRSVDFSKPTSMRFSNHSKSTKLIYWLNYQGVRVLYNRLRPNSSYTQQTFVTHPWIVTSTAGKCIAVYLPNRFPMSFSLN